MADKKSKKINGKNRAVVMITVLAVAGLAVLLTFLLWPPPSAEEAYLAVAEFFSSEEYEDFCADSTDFKNYIISSGAGQEIEVKYEIAEVMETSFKQLVVNFYMKDMIFAEKNNLTKDIVDCVNKLKEQLINCNNYLAETEFEGSGWAVIEGNAFLKKYKAVIEAENKLLLKLNEYYHEAVLTGQFVNEETKTFSKNATEEFERITNKLEGIENSNFDHATLKTEVQALYETVMGGAA